MEGKWPFKVAGSPDGLRKSTLRKHFQDIIYGLVYLHANSVVHGDMTTDNLLVAASGIVKIGDFSVNQVVKVMNCSLSLLGRRTMFICLHTDIWMLLYIPLYKSSVSLN
ncbi:unnamed protein product [Coffea canephora]|uniref:Protein kinase domain-containing protein n=1 Tax=Coffea canephora TaxID=49390 RepID=A0A068UCW8_COFCA|nr:unnamed protein product [Coffea canephora]